MKTFDKLIADLMDDSRVPTKTKIEMMNEWKGKLVAKNSDRLMSKEEGEKHFKWLRMIDDAVNMLAP